MTPAASPDSPGAPDPTALPGGSQVADLSYEQARDALTEVVRRLESGGGTLEESLALWEREEALADHCQQWLDGARARLEAASAARATGEGTDAARG